MKLIESTYPSTDVTWLLKDLSHVDLEINLEQREALVQTGIKHYAEVLPEETAPTQEYMDIYYELLSEHSPLVGEAVSMLSQKIYMGFSKGIVLVSLARAGVPAGILVKRYLSRFYGVDAPHYAISIVRDRGIDYNALNHIQKEHPDKELVFIDGWTGKGAISKELDESLNTYNQDTGSNIKTVLAVISDPASAAHISGTVEDIIIPSGCLNSTVSGLVSRTVLSPDLIGSDDYHGAKFYAHMKSLDVSNEFINAVEQHFTAPGPDITEFYSEPQYTAMDCVHNIMRQYDVENIHRIKPGVCETTRVLLRRKPDRILVRADRKDWAKHILQLATEKDVPVDFVDGLPFTTVGIIEKTKASE